MIRILVAEDHPANRELVRAILESSGYEVIEAERGDDALRLIAEAAPALVLMDIQMPGLDGLSALAVLRQDPRFGKLPVVALTAYAMKEDRERLLAAGFDAYLTKPIEARLLRAELQRLLTNATR